MIFSICSFFSTLASSKIYWPEVFINFGNQLIPAIITAVLTALILDKAFKKSKRLGDSLVKSGIDNIEYASGKMSRSDRDKLFGLNGRPKPDEVSLCFLTGDNFFLDNYRYISELQKSGCKIRVLLANPYDSPRAMIYFDSHQGDFSKEKSLCSAEDKAHLAELYCKYYAYNADETSKLSYLERTYLMVSKDNIERIAQSEYNCSYDTLSSSEKVAVWKKRIGATGDHITQVMIVTKIVEALNKNSTNQIELHYYRDEYRIPITLAKYKKSTISKHRNRGDDYTEYLLWTNMNAPVKETTKSVNVFGKTKDIYDSTYITDVVKTFNYLFDKYSK
ncbi:MAG: hypothetical protein IJX70_03480 [Clostridia bacterium]|nr:hypothetical protein [Clostridia bacterium]